jgi:hypothetical protein
VTYPPLTWQKQMVSKLEEGKKAGYIVQEQNRMTTIFNGGKLVFFLFFLAILICRTARQPDNFVTWLGRGTLWCWPKSISNRILLYFLGWGEEILVHQGSNFMEAPKSSPLGVRRGDLYIGSSLLCSFFFPRTQLYVAHAFISIWLSTASPPYFILSPPPTTLHHHVHLDGEEVVSPDIYLNL